MTTNNNSVYVSVAFILTNGAQKAPSPPQEQDVMFCGQDMEEEEQEEEKEDDEEEQEEEITLIN